MATIYTLEHPTTGEIRYVGKTHSKLTKRLRNHVQASRLYKHHAANWIQSLLKVGLKPVIKEVESCEDHIINGLEQYWISQFRVWGFRLVNSTDGGVGSLGRKHKKETLQLFKDLRKIQKISNKKLVLNLETGIYYETTKDAAEAYNLNRKTLGKRLRKEITNNTAFIFA